MIGIIAGGARCDQNLGGGGGPEQAVILQLRTKRVWRLSAALRAQGP